MFFYTTGDLLQSDAEALVNTVNCEGYMGKGIAYQFKLKFPNNNISILLHTNMDHMTIPLMSLVKELKNFKNSMVPLPQKRPKKSYLINLLANL